MIATILKETNLRASVLVGSAVANLDNRSTLVKGTDFFVAETCEYKRHFLVFRPNILVVTSIEPDHLDYYRDFDDIFSAFLEYAELLAAGGTLIYCADDTGARMLADSIRKKRSDIHFLPYGVSAEGRFRITNVKESVGRTTFTVEGLDAEFDVRIPGKHSILNAAASVATVSLLLQADDRVEKGATGVTEETSSDGTAVATPGKSAGGQAPLTDPEVSIIREALGSFKGSKRRSEIKGEASGVLFMDDYAHHPTAIRTTIEGLKTFYPDRRLVVDFMSHTYSRTKMLLSEFADCFEGADEVILHKIYASAREKAGGTITGEDLFAAVKARHPCVRYFHEVLDAQEYCLSSLKSGDLFITMGAGDNWKLGEAVLESMQHRQ
jgi:UDP-N-acetylmuramate--alanine ligase